MDLIYADSNLNDLGYLEGYNLDFEDSEQQHTFQLKVSRSVWPLLHPGSYVYVDGHSEYGGRITKIRHITSQNEITFEGRTWLGILQTKIICPPINESHRLVSNQSISNAVSDILNETSLSSLFEVATTNGNVSSFQFDRYCTVLSGFQKLYTSRDLRFRCYYDRNRKKVIIRGDTGDNVSTKTLSSYQYDFDVSLNEEPVNHIIGLGSGELVDRLVCHALVRLNHITTRPGEIDVLTQSAYNALTPGQREAVYYTGEKEIVDIYDYPNAESEEDLKDGAKKRLRELQNATNVVVDVVDVDLEIGDIISGIDEITGLSVSKVITGKILKATEFQHSISYKTEE